MATDKSQMAETLTAPPAPAKRETKSFKIPLFRFSKELVGTPDEIWLGVLKVYHGTENHTKDEWKALIDTWRSRPAH